jgi:hypothetical protein
LLELAFETAKIRKICQNEDLAEKELGREIAASLVNRLADLRASSSVYDLIAGNPRPIGHDRFGVSLGDGYTLLMCANHVPPRVLDSGETNWADTHRIRILGWEKLDE